MTLARRGPVGGRPSVAPRASPEVPLRPAERASFHARRDARGRDRRRDATARTRPPDDVHGARRERHRALGRAAGRRELPRRLRPSRGRRSGHRVLGQAEPSRARPRSRAALANLEELATKAAERDNWLWLDMESADYVDGTSTCIASSAPGARTSASASRRTWRTADDVDSLMPLDPIRLVKGIASRASSCSARAVIDEAYRRLALLILARKGPVGRLALGTHDVGLVRQIETDAEGTRGSRCTCCSGSAKPTCSG